MNSEFNIARNIIIRDPYRLSKKNMTPKQKTLTFGIIQRRLNNNFRNSKMKGIINSVGVIFLSGLSLLPLTLHASAEWSITIDMTVVQPQCTINNNKEILINFEKVFIDKIDGQEYKKKPIQFNIACPDKNSADLKLQITGSTASFNLSDKLLETDNPDLGIKIMADNKNLPVNTWLSFSWPQQVPNLEAVLVKRDDATLYGGQFNAGAVMNLAYN